MSNPFATDEQGVIRLTESESMGTVPAICGSLRCWLSGIVMATYETDGSDALSVEG